MTVQATGTAVNDTNFSNNAAQLTIGVTALSDMSVSFAGFPAAALVNAVVTGSVNFTNVGNNPATAAVFSLQLPAALNPANVTVTSAFLGVGNYNPANGVVTFTNPTLALVAPSAVIVASVSFLQTSIGVVGTATTGASNDLNPANNRNLFNVGVSVPVVADVAIIISVPSTITVGQSITAIFTITNNGPGPAANVSAVVTLPNGSTQTLTVGNLGLNAVQVFTVMYSVPITSTTVQNFSGLVTTSTTESTLANNTASAAVNLILLSDVAIALSVPPSVTVGQTITVTIVVTNNGPSPASDTVVVVTLPNGSTQTIAAGNLAVNAKFTSTFTYSVPLASTTVQTFIGQVSSSSFDSNLLNNTATGITTLILLSDVSIGISLPFTSSAGQTVTALITIGNSGPSPASNVSAVITLPNGITQTITVGTLGVNGTFTSTIAYGIPQASTTVQTFSGIVTTTTADTNLANNTASVIVLLPADVTTLITIPANASVSVVIGGTVSFSNIGGTPAQNVAGTVVLPAGATVKTIPAGANTVTVAGLQVIVFPASLSGLGTVNPGAVTSFTFTFRTPVVTGTYTLTSTIATTSPESVTTNNISTAAMTLATPLTNASLSGRVYVDVVRNKVFDTGTDRPLANFRVEVVRFLGTATIVYGSTLTNDQGEYVVKDLPAGGGYSVWFFDSGSLTIFGTPFNTSPVRGGQQVSLLGNPSTGSNTVTGPVSAGTNKLFGASIEDVTLYPEDNITEQNLPLDPSGVVYNSITREPVKGAIVKLIYEGSGAFNAANQTLAGTATEVTGVNGFYQFWFINNPPSGVYRFEVTQPSGFLPPEAIQGGVMGALPLLGAQVGDILVQPQVTAPAVGVNGGGSFIGLNGPVGTQYFFKVDLNLPAGVQVLNNHIPLDPVLIAGALLVSKTGDKTVAELGDSVQYTIRIRNTALGPIAKIRLNDLLPAGFRYIPGTARLGGATIANPAGGIGRELIFDIGAIAGQATLELTYFVRLGVGAQQGDGVNRAQVTSPVLSNVALFKVTVQGGVFSNEGCIIGKVYVDCDGNAIQNNTGGSRELGIPGVRLVMLDGKFIVTDSEGKYSICGVKPQTHVIKVDRTTLPKGSRMVPSSNRNAGVGDSLFVDLKGGELARADFIEGSCSPEVLDQVKARRALGGVLGPEVEKKLPLKIESRPLDSVQPIMPEARQQEKVPAKPGIAP